jgi:hypothetical protein
MTTNDDADKHELVGKDQRPQVTIDLKATEVRSDPLPSESDVPPSSEPNKEEAPILVAPEAPSTTPWWQIEANAQTVLTHMTAGFFGALVALLIAYYGAGAFREKLPLLTERNALDFQNHLSGYDTRINAQDERLAALENAVSAPHPDNARAQADIQSLTEEISGLKQDIAALAKRVDGRPAVAITAPPSSANASQQSVEPLKNRIAELEAQLAQVPKTQVNGQTDSRIPALAASLYNLRRALDEGQPYTAELQSLASLTPVPLDLTSLEADRANGVRNIAQLRESFNASAHTAIEAEAKATDSSAGGLWSKAKSVVRIRKVGNVAGDDTQAVLARTEVQLKANNLRGAIEEANKLKGEAANGFKPWLDGAKARLSADESITRIEGALSTTLGVEKRAGKGS